MRRSQRVCNKQVIIKALQWSADGETSGIACNATPRPEAWCHGSLAVVRRSDGEFIRNLADDVQAVWSSNIRWSPNGHNIMFFERSPLGFAFWISLVDPSGGPGRPLFVVEPQALWGCGVFSRSRRQFCGA